MRAATLADIGAPWEPLGIENAAVADIKPLVTTDLSRTLGAGLCRFERCRFPWKLTYDECVYVIEGRMEIEQEAGMITARAGDVVFVPSGSEVVYSFPETCLLFYSAYPVDWQERREETERSA